METTFMVDSNHKLIEQVEKAGIIASSVTIENFVNGANAGDAKRIGIPNNAPRGGTIEFVGRSKELTNIHERLQQGRQTPAIALCGTGGIGKTELALQYVVNYEASYTAGICWINARDTEISTQLLNYGRTYLELNPPKDLDIQQRLAFCWANWQEGDVLLVFDDVTNLQEIESCLPPLQRRFKVLITTRLQHGSRGIRFIEIQSLDIQTSLMLLSVNLGVDDPRLQNEPELAERICHWFDYLPLGLELAGRYLGRKRELSLVRMLELLDREKLDQKDFASITVALELSWKELSPEAQKLSYVLSLFALGAIPWCMTEQFLQAQRSIVELEELRDDELLKFSLLQRKNTGIFQLHHLTREFIQNKLRTECDPIEAEAIEQSFGHEMAVVLAQIFAGEASLAIAETDASLVLIHVEEVVTRLYHRMNDEDLPRCHTSLMLLCIYQGDYARAAAWGNRCTEEMTQRLGQEHSTIISTLALLSSVYTLQGNLNQAQQVLMDVLERGNELLNEDENFRASVLSDLGSIQATQGDYELAEQNCREALEIKQRLFGDDAVIVATTRCALAEVCRIRGQYAEAEELYSRAFEIYEETSYDQLQKEQVPASSILCAMAVLCLEQGRIQEAEDLAEKSKEVAEAQLGTEHPIYASRISTLAKVFISKGDYQLAENYCEQAVKINETKGNTISLDHSISLSTLASLYSTQGRYDEAARLYEKALSIRKQVFKGKHEQVAEILVALSINAIADGKFQSAEPLLEQGQTMYRSTIGTSHPRYGELLCVLADVRLRQRKVNDAEQLLQEAVEVMQNAFGDSHPKVSDKLALLGVFLIGQERPAQAEPLFQRSLEISKNFFGESNPNVCEYMLFVAELKRSNGHEQEADELYAEAIGIYQQERDKKINPDFSEGLLKLIESYEAQGRFDEVESLYQRLLNISRELLGENHPTVVKLLTNLAKLYTDQLRYDSATPLYEDALRIRQHVFDADHPSIVTNLINLTYNYQSLDRFEEAKQRCVDALAISTKLYGNSDPEVSRLQKVLVSIESSLKKHESTHLAPVPSLPAVKSDGVNSLMEQPTEIPDRPVQDLLAEQVALDRSIKDQSTAIKRKQEEIKKLEQQQKQLEAELQQLQSAQEEIEASLQNQRQDHASRQSTFQPVAEQLLSLIKIEHTALLEPLKLVLDDLQQQRGDYQEAWEKLQAAIQEFNQYKQATDEIRVHLSSHYQSDQSLGSILTPVDRAKISHLLQTVQAQLEEVDRELKQALIIHEQSQQKHLLNFLK
jgi:tetratricopeptide (TPR) repeat protein